MADLLARQVAEQDGLAHHRVGARDHRLRGDDGGQGSEDQQGKGQPGGGEQVEGIFDGGGIAQQQGSLAEVVEQQSRHHQGAPGQPDGTTAKVAHVGVERLRAGDAEHDGPQGDEGDTRSAGHEIEGVERVDGLQDGGVLPDLIGAERRQHPKPEQHDRAEQAADAGGAVMLHPEQDHQYGEGDGQHEGRQLRGDHLQPFDRREHRDGGGDHRIPDEEPHADQTEHHEQGARLGREAAGGQRGEGEDPPFSLVVGPKHQQHIFE